LFDFAVSLLLGIEKIKTINEHKDKRIDAQYYMEVDQESKIRTMLIEAQNFISEFDELVPNLSEIEIKEYRDKISKIYSSFYKKEAKMAGLPNERLKRKHSGANFDSLKNL